MGYAESQVHHLEWLSKHREGNAFTLCLCECASWCIVENFFIIKHKVGFMHKNGEEVIQDSLFVISSLITHGVIWSKLKISYKSEHVKKTRPVTRPVTLRLLSVQDVPNLGNVLTVRICGKCSESCVIHINVFYLGASYIRPNHTPLYCTALQQHPQSCHSGRHKYTHMLHSDACSTPAEALCVL